MLSESCQTDESWNCVGTGGVSSVSLTFLYFVDEETCFGTSLRRGSLGFQECLGNVTRDPRNTRREGHMSEMRSVWSVTRPVCVCPCTDDRLPETGSVRRWSLRERSL